MSTYTLGFDNKYKCFNCNRYFDDVDILIENAWKCPECGEDIYIAAPKLNNGCVMIRKMVSELRKDDIVHVASSFIHSVICVEKIGENKVRIALKDYGVLSYNSNEYVSVITGGYYEEYWNDN